MNALKSGIAFASIFVVGYGIGQSNIAVPDEIDNAELAKMYTNDQAVRTGEIKDSDWDKIATIDRQNQIRTAELLKEDKVKTANDFYHAAMIFQHADGKQGYKLAHELSMISAAKGNKNAKWLSAASWDRFLGSIKENQRFGTQYSSKDGKTFQLNPTDPEPTDSMRKELNCPTLQKAKDRAKDFSLAP